MRDSLRARNIFVMLTNRCNLRCRYCYESDRNSLSGNVSTIKHYLAQELTSKQFDEYFLVFHGGEPFLEFQMLKEISEWCWTEFPSQDIRCMATTNGTCLDESMKDWLRKNSRRFVAILSLDGGKESHNRNRCNSFELIDRIFFATTWPGQPVKMTVSPDTINTLYSDFLEIIGYGLIPNPSLAKEVGWVLTRDLPVFVDQLGKIVDYYLAHPLDVACELVNINPAVFKQNPPLPRKRACGAGANNVAYDVNGAPYPCHTFMADLGQQTPDMSELFEILAKDDGLAISPACADCRLYPACEPCYGLNYSKRGNMGAFDPIMCEFTKARVYASARLYTEMIASSGNYATLQEIEDNELYDMISGIMYLSKNLA